MNHSSRIIIGVTLLLCWLGCVANAMAQTVPGSADPARVRATQGPAPIYKPSLPDQKQAVPPSAGLPFLENAPSFVLKKVEVEGATILSKAAQRKLFARYELKTITTNTINDLIHDLTAYYYKKGYVFSRVVLPPQEIEAGVVKLRVLEGHIGHVAMPPEMLQSSVLKQYIAELKTHKPLTAEQMESFLLRVNDLPGQRVVGVLEPLESGDESAIQLRLRLQEEGVGVTASVNNHGSRFLGPWQAATSVSGSIAPLHRTTLSFSSSLPADEMKYTALRHSWAFLPRMQAEIFGGYVDTQPGFSLRASEIESATADAGLRISYQAIRQRGENLSVAVQLDGRNTNGDTFGTALTRERIRALRAEMSYDVVDRWHGQNIGNFKISQGISALGASDKGDGNLSRQQADPEFRKAELSLMRQQYLGADFLLTAQMMGQYASSPLFSAEEFGYGGTLMGRAYDPSEIIGDHGASANVMVAYSGFAPWHSFGFEPYGFYDVGRVWNEDAGGKPQSGASAGVGMRVAHSTGFAVDMAVAQPLTKQVNDPLTGNDHNPRFLFEIKKSF